MKNFKDELLGYLKSPAFWVAGIILCIGFLFLRPLIKKLPLVGDKLPLLVVALTLAFSLGAMPTYAGPVDGSPTMQAVATSLSPGNVLDSIWVGIIAGFVGLVGLTIASRRVTKGTVQFSAALAVVAGVLFTPVKTHAASYIETRITTLLIRAGNTISATNGFTRYISPDGTNWMSDLTNGAFQVQHPSGMETGFTGITIIGGVTQSWFAGRLCRTNFTGITPSAL